MERSYLGNMFRQTMNVSYLKQKVEQEKGKNEPLVEEPEENFDEKSIRLKRNHNYSKPYQTIVRRGMMFTESNESGGFFSCFCGKKRHSSDINLTNTLLTVKRNNHLDYSLNFDTVSVEMDAKENTIKITVESSEKPQTFHLQKTGQQDMEGWAKDLERAISLSQGSKFRLTYLSSIPNFWKSQAITQQQFSTICDSGDVILFKSKHGAAKMQRVVTASQYDHVGIVMRNQRDQIMILESNSNTGVAFTIWRDVVKYRWYESVEKIAYRKLNIARTEEMLTNMEQFVAENIQKQFKIDLNKILRFNSSMNPTAEEKKNRTYFCSQLVAAVYKSMGLLEKEKSCTQYYPVHFSEGGNLNLLQGSLGPQQIVTFDIEQTRLRY